jgi:hypothetical protein
VSNLENQIQEASEDPGGARKTYLNFSKRKIQLFSAPLADTFLGTLYGLAGSMNLLIHQNLRSLSAISRVLLWGEIYDKPNHFFVKRVKL